MRQRITLLKYIEMRLDAMQRAVDKAETASDQRFESVNEMRSMVTDAASRYMPRAEFEAAHQALVSTVAGLQKFLWMGLGAMLAVQLFIGIVFVLVRKEL